MIDQLRLALEKDLDVKVCDKNKTDQRGFLYSALC